MTNTTQCPNCASIFVISDEQYSMSKGNVRCGSCREKFDVVFLADNDGLVFNPEAALKNNQATKPNQPRSELLRVLSEHAQREEAELSNTNAILIDDSETEDEQLIDFNSKLNIEFENTEDIYESFTESASIPGYLSKDNALENQTYSNSPQLFDNKELTTEQFSHTFILSDEDLLPEELIDEVDSLINHKILGNEFSHSQISMVADQPFSLKTSLLTRFKQTFALLSLSLIGLILLTTLTYQLWLKQMLPAQLTKPLATLQNILDPIISTIPDKVGHALPVRQDLNNLQLLSAKTEAHPTRASTILLRVSFLNRSDIEQPLPRLELSLSDENGGLISRRSFESNDYLYNNATDNLISSNELKKVTVELLAFPKQAHGYELKMLSK